MSVIEEGNSRAKFEFGILITFPVRKRLSWIPQEIENLRERKMVYFSFG